MSSLAQALTDYLSVRRALGFKLDNTGRYLAEFVAYMAEQGATTITVDHALTWATRPSCGLAWRAQRLSMVRGFAQHMRHLDPSTQVPPAGLLRSGYNRATPYLYSDAEIRALIEAAKQLSFPLQAATYESVIGLLAVSGARVGEVIGLDRSDFDADQGALIVRDTKFNKTRRLPLHPNSTAALSSYLELREELQPVCSSAALFVSLRGTRLLYSQVRMTFLRLAAQAGLTPRSATCRPRIHDLRHSFAVANLLDWYRNGADVEASLPRLSAYLGHANPAHTFWYLQAAPELLALAGGRLNSHLEAQP